MQLKPEWVRATVGTIVTNLQSFEFALRLFLSQSVGPADPTLHIDQLKSGDVVSLNHLTNYDSLRKVIRKANDRLAELGAPERVDESLVEVRDAFAHGRVFALRPDGPYRLVKFDRPTDGEVRVAAVLELTPERLRLEVERSGNEVLKVVDVARRLGVTCFPEDRAETPPDFRLEG